MSKRQTQSINARLEKKLAAYLAGAGAAGVGVLALAQSANAKIVYTPTNVKLNNPIQIDLNHDGIVDFELVEFAGYGHSRLLAASPQVSGNAVRGTGEAACGFFGNPVGPGGKFATTSYFGHGAFMAGFFQYSHSSFFGPWANATNRYLGFKFLIDGQVHYGWARVTVTQALLNVVLTGYAYETTPNTPIIEGHISSGTADNIGAADRLAPAPQPASLGMLARGSDGLALWRREEAAELTQ